MADFKPIETQEAFDAAVADVKKQYEGWLSPEDYNAKNADLAKQLEANKTTIADLTAKAKAYESGALKMRIAHENGIPYELAGKLSGDTEEEIKKDAETLAKFVKNQQPQPLANTEHGHVDTNDEYAPYRELLARMKK
jgi:hypothetical protein